MTQSIDQLKNAAQSLFSQAVSYLQGSKVPWRNACAMDTLLDYYTVCNVDPDEKNDAGGMYLKALSPYTGTPLWWDDFGWIGLASLRAVHQEFSEEHCMSFLKIAINAWAYMHGPGWSNKKNNENIVPFTGDDLPGWKQFQDEMQNSNIGGPNVWKKIADTWSPPPPFTEEERENRRPRYSPGGVWNAPIEKRSKPELDGEYCGDRANIEAIQNTVTNCVYTLLSLRIYKAAQFPGYGEVFQESGLDVDLCLQVWKDQIEWFDKWMVQTPAADESLLLELDTESVLVRERATTFHELQEGGQRYWDKSYCKEWVWTGDQGLMLGALREGKAAGKVQSDILDLYPKIVEGVFQKGYQTRAYGPGGKITGKFLLPWFAIVSKNGPYEEEAMGGDDNDYQTGTGVFMRYLLQAYQAEPARFLKYKDAIVDSANKIATPGFGRPADPLGDCDAFTEYQVVDPATQMTPWVNRLAVVLLAIEMSR